MAEGAPPPIPTETATQAGAATPDSPPPTPAPTPDANASRGQNNRRNNNNQNRNSNRNNRAPAASNQTPAPAAGEAAPVPPPVPTRDSFWRSTANTNTQESTVNPDPRAPLEEESNPAKEQQIKELVRMIESGMWERGEEGKRLRERYGKGWVGKAKAWLGGEFDVQVKERTVIANPGAPTAPTGFRGRIQALFREDPNEQGRANDHGEGTIRAERSAELGQAPEPLREIYADRNILNEGTRRIANILWKGAIPAGGMFLLTALTGGSGALIAPAILGSAAGRGLSEAMQMVSGKEAGMREDIAIGRYRYYEKARELSNRVREMESQARYGNRDQANGSEEERVLNTKEYQDAVRDLVNFVHNGEQNAVRFYTANDGKRSILEHPPGDTEPGRGNRTYFGGTEVHQSSNLAPGDTTLDEMENNLSKHKRKWELISTAMSVAGGIGAGAMAFTQAKAALTETMIKTLEGGGNVPLNINGDLVYHNVHMLNGAQNELVQGASKYVFDYNSMLESRQAFAAGADVLGQAGAQHGSHLLGESAGRILGTIGQEANQQLVVRPLAALLAATFGEVVVANLRYGKFNKDRDTMKQASEVQRRKLAPPKSIDTAVVRDYEEHWKTREGINDPDWPAADQWWVSYPAFTNGVAYRMHIEESDEDNGVARVKFVDVNGQMDDRISVVPISWIYRNCYRVQEAENKTPLPRPGNTSPGPSGPTAPGAPTPPTPPHIPSPPVIPILPPPSPPAVPHTPAALTLPPAPPPPTALHIPAPPAAGPLGPVTPTPPTIPPVHSLAMPALPPASGPPTGIAPPTAPGSPIAPIPPILPTPPHIPSPPVTPISPPPSPPAVPHTPAALTLPPAPPPPTALHIPAPPATGPLGLVTPTPPTIPPVHSLAMPPIPPLPPASGPPTGIAPPTAPGSPAAPIPPTPPAPPHIPSPPVTPISPPPSPPAVPHTPAALTLPPAPPAVRPAATTPDIDPTSHTPLPDGTTPDDISMITLDKSIRYTIETDLAARNVGFKPLTDQNDAWIANYLIDQGLSQDEIVTAFSDLFEVNRQHGWKPLPERYGRLHQLRRNIGVMLAHQDTPGTMAVIENEINQLITTAREERARIETANNTTSNRDENHIPVPDAPLNQPTESDEPKAGSRLDFDDQRVRLSRGRDQKINPGDPNIIDVDYHFDDGRTNRQLSDHRQRESDQRNAARIANTELAKLYRIAEEPTYWRKGVSRGEIPGHERLMLGALEQAARENSVTIPDMRDLVVPPDLIRLAKSLFQVSQNPEERMSIVTQLQDEARELINNHLTALAGNWHTPEDIIRASLAGHKVEDSKQAQIVTDADMIRLAQEWQTANSQRHDTNYHDLAPRLEDIGHRYWGRLSQLVGRSLHLGSGRNDDGNGQDDLYGTVIDSGEDNLTLQTNLQRSDTAHGLDTLESEVEQAAEQFESRNPDVSLTTQVARAIVHALNLHDRDEENELRDILASMDDKYQNDLSEMLTAKTNESRLAAHSIIKDEVKNYLDEHPDADGDDTTETDDNRQTRFLQRHGSNNPESPAHQDEVVNNDDV